MNRAERRAKERRAPVVAEGKGPTQPAPTGQTGFIVERRHSGPLPSPEVLQAYDAIAPGAAERIIRMAEAEQAHAHALDNSLLRATSRQVTTGQWLGALVALAALGAATACAWVGKEVAASIIGGTTVVSVVAAFVLGKVLPRSEKE